MDVKCERCGTEYEFEESRIADGGVTVKCSNCDHLFKIRKKTFLLTESVPAKKKGKPAEEHALTVRATTGALLGVKDLITLQQWIVERKVSRDDELSQDGQNWRRLGEIEDLASFFKAVEKPADLPMPASVPNPAPKPPMEPVLPAQASWPASVPDPVSKPLMQPGLPVQESRFQESKAGPSSWGNEYAQQPEYDVVEQWKKRGRRKWYLTAFFLLVLGGIGIWYLAWPESFQRMVRAVVGEEKQVSEVALKQFQQAYTHFLRDSNDELLAAKRDLEGAIQQAQAAFPKAWALLAEVHVTQADKNRERIQQIDEEKDRLQTKMDSLSSKNQPEPGKERQEEMARLRNEIQALQKERDSVLDIAGRAMEEASRAIAKAEAIDPAFFLLKRAKANYLRVSGAKRAQIEAEINAARASKPDDPELLFVEGAFSAEDPAMQDAAAERFARAVALMPEMMRARYRLAKLLVDSNQGDQARIQLDYILTANPSHEQAKVLLAALEKENQVQEETEENAAIGEKPQEEKQPQVKTRTYDDWMTIAETYLQRGNPKQAIEAYGAALDLRPNDVEALTGKGLGYMDLDQNMLAIRWFQRALKVSSRFAVAIMGMAEAYKYSGDLDNALEYYQRYLDVYPDGEEAEIARRNIKELK